MTTQSSNIDEVVFSVVLFLTLAVWERVVSWLTAVAPLPLHALTAQTAS